MKQVTLRMMHSLGAIECMQRVEKIPRAGQLFLIEGLGEAQTIVSVVEKGGVTTLNFQPSSGVYEYVKENLAGWATSRR